MTVRAVARAGSGFDACRATHLMSAQRNRHRKRGLNGDGFFLLCSRNTKGPAEGTGPMVLKAQVNDPLPTRGTSPQ